MTGRRLRSAVAILAALSLAACRPVDAPREPRIVLLVVLDTLAAGHVSHLGYERETTPVLDALGAESTIFERAIAPASYTVATIPSLFTGRLPDRHGLVDNDHALHADEHTLAELMRRAGWRTYGVVANVNGGPRHGLDQGFEEFIEVYDGPGPRGDGKRGPRGRLLHMPTADEIHPFVRARLDALRSDERLLLYLHVREPHGPYDPPLEYKQHFVDARSPEPYVEGEREGLQASMRAGDLGPEVRAGVVRLYDANVRWADANLGIVLDELRARGLYEDALVIVTSDHGEAFWQHGWHGHGADVYDEQVHVPLVVKLPRDRAPRPARVPALVGLIDILPTLVELLELEPPAVKLDGRSFAPQLRDPTRASAHARLLTRSQSEAGLHALITADEKVISVVERDQRGDIAPGAVELYDLVNDPGETRDLAPEQPERAQQLGAELVAYLRQLERDARIAPPPQRPPDTVLLEALGYTASGDD